jgi:hypothetical protein
MSNKYDRKQQVIRAQRDLPPKLDRAKLLAAKEDAAYNGYASTRKVKIPEKTSKTLHVFQSVSDVRLLCTTNPKRGGWGSTQGVHIWMKLRLNVELLPNKVGDARGSY